MSINVVHGGEIYMWCMRQGCRVHAGLVNMFTQGAGGFMHGGENHSVLQRYQRADAANKQLCKF